MIRKALYIFFGLLFTAELSAQYFNDDAAAWLEFSIEKELNQKFNVEFELQNRINNNLSQYGMGTAGIGALYKANKFFRIGAGYRFRINRRLDGSYSLRHQAFTSFIFRKKFNQLLLVYRCRFQAQVQDYNSSNAGSVPSLYNRNRLTAKYELNKRFDVFVAEEIYLPLRMLNEGIDRSRTYIGTAYNFSKKSSVEFYFLFQRELYADRQLRRDFIYGITYTYSF